LPCCAALRPCS